MQAEGKGKNTTDSDKNNNNNSNNNNDKGKKVVVNDALFANIGVLLEDADGDVTTQHNTIKSLLSTLAQE